MSEYLFEREWQKRSERVVFRVDQEHRSFVYFYGKGSMEGTRMFLRFADEAIVELGDAYRTFSLVNLTQLDSAPLRAQFSLGKWLFSNKRYITKIAVFGGRPFEMKLARAVMKIARMREVDFFKTEASARAFLGFPSDVN
jgi:hypothetical protein